MVIFYDLLGNLLHLRSSIKITYVHFESAMQVRVTDLYCHGK